MRAASREEGTAAALGEPFSGNPKSEARRFRPVKAPRRFVSFVLQAYFTTENVMNRIRTNLLLLTALFLTQAPAALASTTWYVNGLTGSDSNTCLVSQAPCKTIGHAISRSSSGDSIIVASATYTENLTIGISLKILGSGANTTIIDGGGVGRVLTISNVNVTLLGVTIRNGVANGTSSAGGGILNGGTLLVIASAISGNTAKISFCFHSQICHAAGGGIYNSNSLTIRSSTLVGNSAQGLYPPSPCFIGEHCLTDGGGIFNSGNMTISNSTLSGNTSFSSSGSGLSHGGGISNSGTAIISNSTLSGNGAGGISNGFTVTLQNSIVANNSPGNCSGTMTSNGYNLSNDNTCKFNRPGDLNSTDPKLGTLGNYGGPTQTIPLLSGSPAIDAGNPAGCTDGLGHLLSTDQRGLPRPDNEDKGGCDMGAYESQRD